MSIDLSPENATFLQQVVSSGDFTSEAAALDEALRLLRERQERRAALRRAVEAGIASETLSREQVFANLERIAKEI